MEFAYRYFSWIFSLIVLNDAYTEFNFHLLKAESFSVLTLDHCMCTYQQGFVTAQ